MDDSLTEPFQYRIFILSPARSTGKRADMLTRIQAQFELALRLRDSGAPVGEVFSFLSGLYFRGKLLYANHFARPQPGFPGVMVITSDRGLIPADTLITKQDLESFSGVDINPSDERYVQALTASARELEQNLPVNAEVVLLGSIGTKKYAELLQEIFGDRLKFPADFVGRGDMSRGGLLLRCVTSGSELEYITVAGAIRHGKRPPKLEPIKRTVNSNSRE